MNFAYVSGYVQRDPRVSSGSRTKVAHFTVASKQGDSPTNYIPVVAFGRKADAAEGLSRDDYVEIRGFLQSGSYEKDGKTVYTFDLNAQRIIPVEPDEGDGKPPFGEKPKGKKPQTRRGRKQAKKQKEEDSYELLEDDGSFDDIF